MQWKWLWREWKAVNSPLTSLLLPPHTEAHTQTMEYLHAGNKDDADARPFKSSGGKSELTKFNSEVNLI